MSSFIFPQRAARRNHVYLNAFVASLLFAVFISLSPIWAGFVGVSGNVIFLLSTLSLIMIGNFRDSGVMATAQFISWIFLIIAIIFALSLLIQVSPLIAIAFIAVLILIFRRNALSFFNSFLIAANNIRLSKNIFLAIIILILFSLFNSLFWGVITAKILIYIIFSLIAISYLNVGILHRFIEVATIFHLVMTLFAIVGFIYAASGGEAIFSIINEDGRDNGFYLATFSNTYLLGFIRPSGIYDEPGALSFILCAIALIRDSLGMNRKRTVTLLALGLITSSVAHLIFLIIFLAGSGIRLQIKFLIYALFLVAAILVFDTSLLTVFEELSSRFIIVDGAIAGDNRSDLILNALYYFNPSSAVFGLDSNCILNTAACEAMNYYKYGENPLTPMIHYGLLLAFSYYFALMLFVLYAVRTRSFAAFGFMLLLLQRPYVLSFGYSLLIVVCLFALHHSYVKLKGFRCL